MCSPSVEVGKNGSGGGSASRAGPSTGLFDRVGTDYLFRPTVMGTLGHDVELRFRVERRRRRVTGQHRSAAIPSSTCILWTDCQRHVLVDCRDERRSSRGCTSSEHGCPDIPFVELNVGQQWRQFPFFDVVPVKDPHDLDSSPYIFKVYYRAIDRVKVLNRSTQVATEISTVASSSRGMLVADIHGSVHLLNRDFETVTSWVAHVAGRVTHMAERNGILVTLGVCISWY
jgi:hypothetical protein